MSQVEPEEAFAELSDAILGRVNVALPGVVLSYDEANNTALVRPAVRLHRIDEDTEERVAERQADCPRVPVARPQFGSYFELECPLQAGDHVLLLACDRSIDEYVQTGRDDNIPQDTRRFDFTDAVALPVWLRSQDEATCKVKVTAAGTITVEGTAIKLGDGATQTVALSPLVATNLTNIATILGLLAGVWNGTQPAGGPLSAPPSTPMPVFVPASTAATKTTAE